MDTERTGGKHYNVCFDECFTNSKMYGVVIHALGFLSQKFRSEIAKRLKNGDVTVEEFRQSIVGELDDIKSKLGGLARKDLLSSLCSLQEGINGLYQSLLQFDSDSNTTQSTGQVALVETASSRDTGLESTINEAIVLINAIASLKIRSNDRFKSAMKSFEKAHDKATDAFCNEALSIEDRIQASQIRMMARILEKLEDPDASVSDCLQYLKQLHDIGAIQEILSVLIDGGIKSRFNKNKRLNNAWSVQFMNQTLFEFARKFTKSSLLGWLSQWPLISLGVKSYHPVFGEDRVFQKCKESGLQVMLPYSVFTPDRKVIDPFFSILNSKGETVAKMMRENTLKIFKRSGENRTLCEIPREEHSSLCGVATMDIDTEDNIYVIIKFQESENDDQSWSFKLFIFDENGNKKLESPLPFHQNSRRPKVRTAINKDGKIAILDCQEKILYIGNVCEEMNSFKVDRIFCLFGLYIQGFISYVNVWFSDFNGTKVIVADNYTVYIYTENAQLQCKIKISKEHGFIDSVAINHVTKRILVKTYQPPGRRSLLRFSNTGELIGSLYLGSSRWICLAGLVSHPNGPVALVCKNEAVLLEHRWNH